MSNEPGLTKSPVPDHGPQFWERVDAALSGESVAAPTGIGSGPSSIAGRGTRQAGGSGRGRMSRLLPAAAAIVVVCAGGWVAMRQSAEPTTELVVAEPIGIEAAGESNGGDTGDLVAPTATADSDPAHSVDSASDSADSADPADPADPAGSSGSAGTAEPGSDSLAGTQGDAGGTALNPETTAEGQAPEPARTANYVIAAGNDDTQIHLPKVPLADGARFLATWESQQVTWFSIELPIQPRSQTQDTSVETESVACDRSNHAEIRYATADGDLFDAGDPQPAFAGDISHFVHDGRNLAWISECDGRLGLFVATQGDVAGRMSQVQRAWAGRGSDTAAKMSLDGDSLVFSSIDEQGEPFYVDVDLETRTVSGSGLRVDVGAETGRDSWLVGSTLDDSTTWWNRTTSATATCDGSTLVRHTDLYGWQEPFVDPVDIGGVVALAVNPELSQVALADACPGLDQGRFFLGTLRADGLISSVREVDLSPFATGNVFVLDWVDPLTLRIHTDESVTGGDPLRFDYVFDDGRDGGVLVLLN